MASNRHARTARHRTLLVEWCLLLAVVFPSGGQELIRPILPSGPIGVGDSVLLEMEFEHPGGSELPELLVPEYPRPLSSGAEPTIEVLSRRFGASGVGRELRVRVPLRAVEAGRAVVDAFRFDFGEHSIYSEPFLVEVRPRGGGEVPFDLVWSVEQTDLFVGQTVPVSLEMRNLREPAFPDELRVTEPDNARFVSVPGVGGIQRQTIGELTLLHVPAAAYLLTPTAPGTVVLPQAELRAGGIQGTAAPLSFEVRTLPEQVLGTGAYGRFQYSYELDPPHLTEGVAGTLYIRLQGEGNFDQLQLPSFSSDEFIVAGEGVRTRIEPSRGGYQGSIESRYRITPRAAGSVELVVPEFVWLDAEDHQVRREAPSPLRLSIEARADPDSANGEAGARSPLSPTEIVAMQRGNWYRSPASYLSLMPAVLVIVLGTVFRRRRAALGSAALLVSMVGVLSLLGASAPPQETDERLRAAVNAHRAGSYATALNAYGELLEETPDSPGLWFNSGLAYLENGQAAEAVYSLRRSVMLDPGLQRTRNELLSIEAELRLSRQLELPMVYHPDLFFLFLIAAVSGAAVLGGLSNLRGGTVIGLILFSAAAFISLGAMLYSARVLGNPVTIVAVDGANMKRIPEHDAAVWLRLAAGTAVESSVRHAGFVLVRTGDRVEGWVEAAALLGTNGFRVSGGVNEPESNDGS